MQLSQWHVDRSIHGVAFIFSLCPNVQEFIAIRRKLGQTVTFGLHNMNKFRLNPIQNYLMHTEKATLKRLEPKLPGGTSHRVIGGGKLLGAILQPWGLCFGILVFFL